MKNVATGEVPVSPPSVERLATGRPQGVRAKIFLTRWGESSEANYRDYVDFLFKWGVIKQKIETADLITNELVAEANALDAADRRRGEGLQVHPLTRGHGMGTIDNRVRQRLAAGELCIGMALRQARTVDIGRVIAACGYDFAFIDMEHNSMGVDTAAQIAVACHDAGVTPLVRVPGYEHYLATRLLDAGAMGIVFPHVDSADHARQLVASCKYPPVGHRSLGGPMAQLGFRPVSRAESSAAVNREILLVMMLETPAAIASADAIAAVPGVDVLLIGTNDLTLEMGVPGKYDEPAVAAAYATVVAACRKHGKYPGMGGIYDHPTMEKYIRAGARFVLCGSDLQFLMAAGTARAEFLRKLSLR